MVYVGIAVVQSVEEFVDRFGLLVMTDVHVLKFANLAISRLLFCSVSIRVNLGSIASLL